MVNRLRDLRHILGDKSSSPSQRIEVATRYLDDVFDKLRLGELYSWYTVEAVWNDNGDLYGEYVRAKDYHDAIEQFYKEAAIAAESETIKDDLTVICVHHGLVYDLQPDHTVLERFW